MLKFLFLRDRGDHTPLRSRLQPPNAWYLVPIVAVYLALAIPTVLPQDINWDERVDLTIASHYLDGPDGFWNGSGDDRSQTRLPMYSVALLSLVTGGLDLVLARAVSIVVGALTLFGVYTFCRQQLDDFKGLLAAGLMATSPYFLAFAGLAFTEGDVFITCAAVWVLVAGSRLTRERTVGAAALVGVLLGLAVSSKFFGIALIPAVLLAFLVDVPEGSSETRDDDTTVRALRAFIPLPVSLASALLLLDPLELLEHDLLRLALVVLTSSALLGWAWMHRRRIASRALGSTVVVASSMLTFLVIPPVHTTNSLILRDLFAKSSGGGISADRVMEFAAFHASVLLLKPGILIGLGLFVGSVAALIHLRSRRKLQLPVLMAAGYFVFASLTPVAQTFYMMPVFALMVVLMADWLVEIGRRSRLAFAAVALPCIATATADLAVTYPSFALNGYQWTGEQYWAGRATLGYRAIAQVRSDGIEEVLLWAQNNVPAGATAVGFMEGPHIIRAVSPDPPYRFIDAMRTMPDGACRDLSCADWVFTQINAQILQRYDGSQPADSIYRYRFDRSILESEFEKVFAVTRPFDLEVAQVWRRRARAEASSTSS